MRAAEQALAVYNKAAARFDNGTATKVDEVLLALWDETKEQAQRLREMAAKIAMLESKDILVATVSATASYAALVQRLAPGVSKSSN
jgi:uncharacterized hydantoinase/oxoprolinase family protein